ncbi:MAG: MFS transporter [Anaerolineae bacterium]
MTAGIAKLVMVISDVAAGLATIAIFFLYNGGQLQMWHLYARRAHGQARSNPSNGRPTRLLSQPRSPKPIPVLMLCSGRISFRHFGSPLAGFLLVAVGLIGIMMIDIVTFLVAVAGVLLVTIPQPARSEAGMHGKGSLWSESIYGFRYIFQRPSLLGLQLVFFIGNLLASLAFILINPMILSRTANNEFVLGLVQAAFGIGAVIGGLILVRTGGLKRRVHGVLMGWFLSSLFGLVLFGVGRTLPIWIVFGLLASIMNTYINASNQSIWQSKVAPDVQGRVFSTRRLIAQIIGPVGILLAGPLADRIFEPAMQLRTLSEPLNVLLAGPLVTHAFASARVGDGWTNIFGWLVGVGPGAGMALLFVITGLLAMLVGAGGYLFPAIRNAEDLLPDHDFAA